MPATFGRGFDAFGRVFDVSGMGKEEEKKEKMDKGDPKRFSSDSITSVFLARMPLLLVFVISYS